VLTLGTGAGAVAADRLLPRTEAPPGPTVAPDSAPGLRTQRTVLLALAAPDGSATAAALLAADDATGAGSVVLVPPRVLAEVPGSGSLPFGRALSLPGGEQLARAALADLVGITVDASWVLDGAALTTLVNGVGGVTVDVDVDVLAGPADAPQVVVPRGPRQRLDGVSALAFVSYAAPDEDDLVRLPRLQELLDGLLAALPAGAEPPELAERLGLGDPRRQAAAPTVAQVVAALRDGAGTDAVSYTVLPVLPLDSGGARSTYRIDPAGVRRLTDARLAGSVPPGRRAGDNRVLVLNGVGTPGIGESVRERLVPAGLVYVGSRNAQPFGRERTVVVVFDRSAASLRLAEKLRAALVLPDASVQVSTRSQSIADAFVVVGRDFRP